MAVETLAAFRAAEQGMNVQPVIVTVKGTDGELYLAEADPTTGGLVVDVGTSFSDALAAAGLATESKQDTIISHVDGIETVLGTIDADTSSISSDTSSIASDASAIASNVSTLAAVAFATETTAQLLREWPYASYDKQKLTQGASTDTWEYMSGVTVVGTILITYTDATKAVIDNVSYSPAKDV